MASGDGVLENEILPLVEFSVGDVKNKAKFNFEMYKSTDPSHGNKRKLVCETPHLNYVGSNFDYDPSREHLDRYLIIRDKTTGKKRIFRTEDFKLYPVVTREDEVDSETERLEAIERAKKDARTFSDKLDNLTVAFGSKNKKRAMESRLRNKISDTSQRIADSVKSHVETEGMRGGDSSETTHLSILPYNKDATSEEHVYPLENYIPPNVQEAVTEASEALLDIDEEKVQAWKDERNPLASRYVLLRARSMHPSVANDEDVKREYLACLQLMAYLMKFYLGNGKTDEKKRYVESISYTWKEWFRETFTPENKSVSLNRRNPPSVKARILAYAVVLAWHIESNQFDVEMLGEGFGVSRVTVSQVVKALGGTVKNSVTAGVQRCYGLLQLPLTFPKESRGKRR